MPKLTLEECLAKNGFLTYRIRGVSMQPMLRQGRDLFTVVPKGSERYKKYDVVLYRRPSIFSSRKTKGRLTRMCCTASLKCARTAM